MDRVQSKSNWYAYEYARTWFSKSFLYFIEENVSVVADNNLEGFDGLELVIDVFKHF